MQSKNILIFGNGQLGNFYHKYFQAQKIKSTLTDVDVTKIENIAKKVKEIKPTIILNATGMTNLEWCAKNRLETFNVNVLGVDNLAEVCDKNNIYFIHLSSGCIMESKTADDIKTENDTPNPISYYSWTKFWAEQLLTFKRSENFKCLILRLRQPVSGQLHHKNMLTKMLTFTRFIDTPNSGTVIEDLMDWTLQLLKQGKTGIFNVANIGWTTPYEISLLIKRHLLPTLEPIKITKNQLNEMTPETRVDTVLDVTKLQKHVKNVKPYKQRLEELIINLADFVKKSDPKYIREQLEITVEHSKQRTIINEVWQTLISKP